MPNHVAFSLPMTARLSFCDEGESPPNVLAYLSSAVPKLVLLDLKLPKLDGLQVLREIKANPECRAIPVVVLTSSGEERDIVESYELGVNSYIQKPVDIAQFRQAVKAVGFYWLVVNQPPA